MTQILQPVLQTHSKLYYNGKIVLSSDPEIKKTRKVGCGRAWLPVKLSSGNWAWGKKIYIETTHERGGDEYKCYSKGEIVIEKLTDPDLIVTKQPVVFVVTNPLLYLLLPAFVILAIVVSVILSVFKSAL